MMLLRVIGTQDAQKPRAALAEALSAAGRWCNI